MSELKKPIENSLESLSLTIPFSCRDWGQEKRDAWVYGIVCGWGDDCRAEFENKFGWNTETFDRLKRLHAHFEEVRRAQPGNEPLTHCADCQYYTPSPMGGNGCLIRFNGRTEIIPRNPTDFCSHGVRKPERSEG